MTTAAYHEAGHIVVAASLGLCLRPEGIMVGQDAQGLACFCKEPDGTDASVEANILASFAGFYTERRLRAMRGYKPRDFLAVMWSPDWIEARAKEKLFSGSYLAGRTIPAVQETLEVRAEQLVAQYWSPIEGLAQTLLSRDWEPIKPLKSGMRWSESEGAKYVTGHEVVDILGRLGITAHSAP